MIVYIYVLVDPRDNETFYVGYTKSPKSRLNMHILEAKKGRYENMFPLKHIRVREILISGRKPEMRILEQVSKEHADQREAYWFDYLLSQGMKLINSNKPRLSKQQGWVTLYKHRLDFSEE